LTDRTPDAATHGAVVEHAQRSVTRLAGGGFELTAAGAPAVRVVPDTGGWRIEGDPGMQGWSLRRVEPRIGGFVLMQAEREIGRTMASKEVLLEDGRLFRIVRQAQGEGFELAGWEVPGAYLRAVAQGEGFRLEATVAGGGIPDIRALTLLFAAEALDSAGALETQAR
jgi:hypothetical protein